MSELVDTNLLLFFHITSFEILSYCLYGYRVAIKRIVWLNYYKIQSGAGKVMIEYDIGSKEKGDEAL